MGGDCCAWSPAEPEIRPGDMVSFQADDGYENQIRVGGIYGIVDLDDDTVTGPIHASWFDQTLAVSCWVDWLHGRQSSAAPDGSVPYAGDFQDPAGGSLWDIGPDDNLAVTYWEPDGDVVYRRMRASQGALPPCLYLPLTLR
jgi:hypothetical protein